MCSEGPRVRGLRQTGLGTRRSHRSCPAAGRTPGQGSRPRRSRRRSPACHRSGALPAGSAWTAPHCKGRCPQGTGSPAARRQVLSSCPHRSRRHTRPRCCTATGPAGTCRCHSGTHQTGRTPGPASLWDEEHGGEAVRGEQSLPQRGAWDQEWAGWSLSQGASAGPRILQGPWPQYGHLTDRGFWNARVGSVPDLRWG